MTYNTRKSYIDILKTIAIISVIFCHLQLNDAIGTNVWFIRCDNYIIDRLWYILGYVFANMSIPMFMLLTGANRFRNIENKNIDYRKLIKEIIKAILLLIVFQLPLYVYKHIKYGDILSAKDFILTLYSSNIEPIYWYFPGFYLAFLFSFPILKKFTINATKKDYEYLFIVYVVVQLIFNNILKYFGINISIPFSIFSYIYMYPLFGDLICNKYDLSDFAKNRFLVLLVCAVAYFYTNETYDAMNIYLAMIILILMRICSSKTSDFEKFRSFKSYSIIDISARFALVFYLLHPYIVRIVYKLSNKVYPSSIMYLDYIVGIVFLLINYFFTFIVIYVLIYFTRKVVVLGKNDKL